MLQFLRPQPVCKHRAIRQDFFQLPQLRVLCLGFVQDGNPYRLDSAKVAEAGEMGVLDLDNVALPGSTL